MRHSNISIFVPHLGCPNACSFCNQHTISGEKTAPDASEVRRLLSESYDRIKDKQNTQIAFFGGSFTAIDEDYMLSLLKTAFEFVGKNGFSGIRISTRPDFIDSQILDTLKRYGVTSIEIGAQSMCDEVLCANNRGHTEKDVENASRLIREYGFELGLQMMTGLYKSDSEKDMLTAQKIILLKPDTVRIYPVCVLKNTYLARLYNEGKYALSPFDDMVSLCADLLLMFESAGIKVIKCGLHASDGVEGELVAGYYHPAFRELCEGRIYRNAMDKIILGSMDKSFVFSVNDRCISKARGQKNENIRYFEKKGISISLIPDKTVKKYIVVRI